MQLVHVLFELRLAHLVHSLVRPVLVTAGKPLIGSSTHVWAHVDQHFDVLHLWAYYIEEVLDVLSLTRVAVLRHEVRYGPFVHDSGSTGTLQSSLIFVQNLSGKSCVHRHL